MEDRLLSGASWLLEWGIRLGALSDRLERLGGSSVILEKLSVEQDGSTSALHSNFCSGSGLTSLLITNVTSLFTFRLKCWRVWACVSPSKGIPFTLRISSPEHI